MERNSFSFLKQFLDAIDTEDLSYDEKCHAAYALCYYAIRGAFPHEANGMDKMYVRANEKLLEGQDKFKEEQSERGLNGGKSARITDEQIRAAYKELYVELGRHPGEQEVIEKCGGGVQRIASRKVWKENKDEWVKDCIDTQSIHTYTENIQDIHTDTYMNF